MSHWSGIRTIVICYISKILLVPIGMYIQWQKNVYLVKSKPHPSGKDPFQSQSLGASPLGIRIGIGIFALRIRFGFYKVNILLSLDSSIPNRYGEFHLVNMGIWIFPYFCLQCNWIVSAVGPDQNKQSLFSHPPWTIIILTSCAGSCIMIVKHIGLQQ